MLLCYGHRYDGFLGMIIPFKTQIISATMDMVTDYGVKMKDNMTTHQISMYIDFIL